VSLLDDYQVICTVGNAKNAGKTTVLNYLINQYQNKKVGISSIGLDGEKIDQITFLPKPRIYVWPQMLVATALECLKECEAAYELISTTNIVTALGPIVLIKITKAGPCLVGGPSTVQSMQLLIEELKKHSCEKILLDGAFSRTTLAQISEATIFCVGASYSYQLDKLVAHTKNTVRLFQLPPYTGPVDLAGQNEILLIDDNNEFLSLKTSTTLDCGAEIIAQISPEIRSVFIPKAVSSSFLQAFIDQRKRLNCDLIITSPTHLMIDERLLRQLFRLKQKLYVLQPINLVALTFNPFSPTGNRFSLAAFREQLSDDFSLPIYDVLEKSEKYE